MWLLQPCVLSHTGLIYSALQAPSRPSLPSPCQARRVAHPSFCTRSSFSHAMRRVQPCLHICSAKDQVFSLSRSAMLQLYNRSAGLHIVSLHLDQLLPMYISLGMSGHAPLPEVMCPWIQGSQPPSQAPYKVSSLESQEIQKQLQELNDKGYIRPSKQGRHVAGGIFVSGLQLWTRILLHQFLPSILVSAVALGLFYPNLGQRLYQIGLSKWATFGVFLISGLTLRTSDVGNVLQAWPSLLFGVVSSLVITPWISVLVLQFPIIPREFVTGLALFCCMPTTLSSGVTLSQVAGANAALALSVTLVSNLLGILTIPFVISKVVAPNLGISIPTGPLMKSLLETSLIPLLIGKVIRVYASGFIDKRKKELAILSSIFLGLVPWMQVSCGRDLFLSLKMQNIAAAALLGLGIHCSFLLWTFLGIHTLHICVKESKNPHQRKSNAWAIILTASQKTLPIAIAVIGSLHGLMGESGLLVLPCLIAHINQIIFDSFLVQLWIQGDLQKSLGTIH